FFSSRRRHTRLVSDWSSDVCSSDLSGWGKLRPGGDPDKRRNEGNEIMLIPPRNIQALACCAGACLQSFWHLGKFQPAKTGEYSTDVDTHTQDMPPYSRSTCHRPSFLTRKW